MPKERLIFRHPAPGTFMKRPLQCIDLDSANPDVDQLVGTECQKKYLAKGPGVKFVCPNRKSGNGHLCQTGTFLYPRKLNGKKGYFHFHQGIDLGQLDKSSEEGKGRKTSAGLDIISVTDGIVVWTQEWDGESSGYGTAVAVWNRDMGRMFWYSHLQQNSIKVKIGETVVEQQPLALLGNSGKAGKPHLHFEVIDSPAKGSRPKFKRIIGGKDWERELGNPRGPRLDPLEVLEELGPWGARQVFDVLGRKMAPAIAEDLHLAVEQISFGGYFPLGANNFWHGGVHVARPKGSAVHAPFSATIVAARLAPDEASGMATFGHTSFILLKHEISQTVFDRMQRGPDAPPPKPEPKPKKVRIAVGRKVTDPQAVNDLKAKLNELGFYEPEDDAQLSDGKVEPALGEAIKAFQETLDNPFKKNKDRWPDGVVDVPGYTWNHLFPKDDDDSDDDDDDSDEDDEDTRRRTIYMLLMHLQPMTLQEARKAGIKWVERVSLPGKNEEEDDDDDDEDEEEDPDDRTEADAHRIGADVKLGSTNTEDIEWVEKRLIRLEFLTSRTEPTGVADEELDAAIKAFQQEHPWPHKPKFWDGIVQKNGRTDKFLRKTEFELREEKKKSKKKPKKPSIDPDFIAAVEEVDENGISKVVSGLDVHVVGQEGLWTSGVAKSFNELGKTALREEIHWEIFAEELVIPTWDTIDDAGDDLTADVPATVMERVDTEKNRLISVSEISAFYCDKACEPLRRTVCRFRTEWGLDIPKTIKRLEERGLSTKGFEDAVAPYQWWDKAADVLPKGVMHVWHYNPIEFLAAYQQILDDLKPPPPPPPKDPAKHGNLVVHVEGDTGMRPKKNVTVVASPGPGAGESAAIDADGVATFHQLPIGEYRLFIEEHDDEQMFVKVKPFGTTEATFVTELEGKPIPRKDLTVWVRTAQGTAAVGARVDISGKKLDIADTSLRVGKKSRVVFEGLQPGDYTLKVVHPDKPEHDNEVVHAEQKLTFGGKNKKVRVNLPPAKGTVTVHYDDGGAKRAGSIFDEHGTFLFPFITNGSGRAEFTLPHGKYKLTIDGHSKKINLRKPEMDVTIK